jgi:hypothetical protein
MIHKVNSAISKQTVCGLDLTMYVDLDKNTEKMEIATEGAFEWLSQDPLCMWLCQDCLED